MAEPAAAEVAPPAEVVKGEKEEGGEEAEQRIRVYPIDPEIARKMRESYPYFVRKGAKSKTEFPDKCVLVYPLAPLQHDRCRSLWPYSKARRPQDAGNVLRSACINPTEAQIEAIMISAKAREKNTTTRGYYTYENFEQRVAEYMFLHKGCFARNSTEKILEAMQICLHGKAVIEATNFKTLIMSKGHPFTEEESSRLLHVARDKDTGLVYVDEYATLLAHDGIPPPPDPLEPCDERFR